MYTYEGRSEKIQTFHALVFHLQLPTHIIHEQKCMFIPYKLVSLFSATSVYNYTKFFEHLSKVQLCKDNHGL